MKDIGTKVLESLEQLRGKSSSQITNALKRIGGGEDGSMVDGLIYIVTMLNKDKHRCVTLAGIGGIGIGIAGTVIYTKQKEKTQCRKKIERVAEILRQEAAINNNESVPHAETEVPTENKDVIPVEANPIV